MQFHIKYAVLLCFFLLSGCAEIKVGSVETVNLHLDNSWVLIQQEQYPNSKNLSKAVYRHNVSFLQNNYETIEIAAYDKQSSVQNYRKDYLDHYWIPSCSSTKKPVILYQDESGYLLEELIIPCFGEMLSVSEHKLIRVVDGQYQRFVITYYFDRHRFSNEIRKNAIRILMEPNISSQQSSK